MLNELIGKVDMAIIIFKAFRGTLPTLLGRYLFEVAKAYIVGVDCMSESKKKKKQVRRKQVSRWREVVSIINMSLSC